VSRAESAVANEQPRATSAPVASVLVTDGDERAALATVRSLGRAGHRVYVCAARDRALAGASRYCHASATVPSPLREAERLPGGGEGLIERWGIQVLLPMSEQSLRALLPAGLEGRGVRVRSPTWPRSPVCRTRVSCSGDARASAWPFPRSRYSTRPTIFRPSRPGLTFPTVVKPTRSVVATRAGSVKTAWRTPPTRGTTTSPGDALAELYPLLLQDASWAREAASSCSSGRRAGGVVLSSASAREATGRRRQRVQRERRRRPAAPRPRAAAAARLRLAGRRDAGVQDRRANPGSRTSWRSTGDCGDRCSSPSTLASTFPPCWSVAPSASGAPRPCTVWVSATDGGGATSITSWRVCAIARRSWPAPGAPSRWRVVRDFLRVGRRGDRNEVLRLGDPWPFVRETVDWLRRA